MEGQRLQLNFASQMTSPWIRRAIYMLRIREIAAYGMVTTIAGTGSPGISGDGGLATNAQVGNFLCGIAVDGSGSVYVADCSGHVNGGFIRPNILCSATVALPACSGHRIRRITADGVITTF